MKTERTATYSSLLSFPYLVLRTKAKRKREGVVHEIRQYLGGGGHCVFKWILRRHLKPTANATISIMFEVISIKFW